MSMNLGRKLFLACQYLIILKNHVPFLLMIDMNSLLNLSGGFRATKVFINASEQKAGNRSLVDNVSLPWQFSGGWTSTPSVAG